MSVECGPDPRLGKIVSLEQQRLSGIASERIGEAVAKIQLGRMPTALAEIAISFAGDFGLSFRDRGYDYFGVEDQFVQMSAENRIAHAVDHYRSFEISGC